MFTGKISALASRKHCPNSKTALFPSPPLLWHNPQRPMERTEIITKLAAIVRKVTKSEIEIREETRLIEDLGVDSLDLLEIVMAVEDMFRIKITDQDFSHLATVSAAVSYIQDKTPL